MREKREEEGGNLSVPQNFCMKVGQNLYTEGSRMKLQDNFRAYLGLHGSCIAVSAPFYWHAEFLLKCWQCS